MSRSTKYSEQAVKNICDALAAGVPKKYAAAAGGISYQTMCEWEKAGEKGEKPFVSFLSATKEAQAKAVPTLLLLIRKHAAKNWTAAAWMLERLYPEEFGRQRLEISGPGGGPVEHSVAPIQFIVVPPANAHDYASED